MNQKPKEMTLKKRLELWKRMEKGDSKALILLMVDRGMAKEEDFVDYFPKPSKKIKEKKVDNDEFGTG